MTILCYVVLAVSIAIVVTLATIAVFVLLFNLSDWLDERDGRVTGPIARVALIALAIVSWPAVQLLGLMRGPR